MVLPGIYGHHRFARSSASNLYDARVVSWSAAGVAWLSDES